MELTKSRLAEQIDRNAPELLKSLPQWVLWRYQQPRPGQNQPPAMSAAVQIRIFPPSEICPENSINFANLWV